MQTYKEVNLDGKNVHFKEVPLPSETIDLIEKWMSFHNKPFAECEAECDMLYDGGNGVPSSLEGDGYKLYHFEDYPAQYWRNHLVVDFEDTSETKKQMSIEFKADADDSYKNFCFSFYNTDMFTIDKDGWDDYVGGISFDIIPFDFDKKFAGDYVVGNDTDVWIARVVRDTH